MGDPEATYKIAQAYAMLGDKASALRVFKHSIESGFFPYPYFLTDPLLDSLRNEPEFSKLMTASPLPWTDWRNILSLANCYSGCETIRSAKRARIQWDTE